MQDTTRFILERDRVRAACYRRIHELRPGASTWASATAFNLTKSIRHGLRPWLRVLRSGRARSHACCSRAPIEEADPNPATATEILDAVPGAFERHQEGRTDAQEGRRKPAEDL